LLGHIVIGLRMLGRKLDAIPAFPAKLRSLLEHMLISHHGELEFGSPKVPIFQEALLLHHLDNLDSKMATMSAAVCREQHNSGEFTGWIAPLERVVLRKAQYMAGPAVAAAKTESMPIAKPDVQPMTPVTPPDAPLAAEHPAPVPPNDDRKAPLNTLFGEKLQAVLRK
jgi:3'-5' exoribonuclease